jgi:type III secretion system YscD/HrpQ family protein
MTTDTANTPLAGDIRPNVASTKQHMDTPTETSVTDPTATTIAIDSTAVNPATPQSPVSDSEEPDATQSAPAAQDSTRVSSQLPNRVRSSLISSSVILLTVIVAQLWQTSQATIEANPVSHEASEQADQIADLEHYLLDNGFSAVNVSIHGQPHLSGYVNYRKDLVSITSFLADNTIEASVTIIPTETLKAAAESVLALLQLDSIQIDYGRKPGELVATGKVGNVEAWEIAKRKIKGEINGITSLIDSVGTLTAEKLYLTQALIAAGLTDQVVISTYADHLSVELWVHPKHQTTWEEIVTEFRETFGSSERLKVAPVTIRGMNIKGVSIGRNPFIKTTDNIQYTTGDLLPNGFILSEIMEDYLLFSMDGKYVTYVISDFSN